MTPCGMQPVRVLIAEGVYALLTVVDGVPYLAPLRSEPIDTAPAGVWHTAEVVLSRRPWASQPPPRPQLHSV